jgi:hypothetical protein
MDGQAVSRALMLFGLPLKSLQEFFVFESKLTNLR